MYVLYVVCRAPFLLSKCPSEYLDLRHCTEDWIDTAL